MTSGALLRDPNRVVVEAVEPQVDGGRFPVKRVVGDALKITADVFVDGHDQVGACVWLRSPADTATREFAMEPLGNDCFGTTVDLDIEGRWAFTVVGWIDRFATWRDATLRKAAAGQDVSVELQIGAGMVAAAAERAQGPEKVLLTDAAAILDEGEADGLGAEALARSMRRWAERETLVRYPRTFEVVVERERAGWGAWYEMFPRSASPDPRRHGTLADVAERLPYVAQMGFDVVYLPPIHPIGASFRKGPNNTPQAAATDPGSPWAIGSAAGGHQAIAPELGGFDDFDALMARAAELGLEIALDLAWQCSPDHPWVTEHPEWFRHRPDGSIQYAENPPKRYQDIYPLDFECEAWQSLWDALLGVVDFWVARGVRIFRVDNPHTKPFRFWEWLIASVHADHPDVVFLSEAFTRPKAMYHLAKLGFSQSYTYFTWRETAAELRSYFEELRDPAVSQFFRPNLWPNTPDILPEHLQHGGRPAFVQRFVLAATLAANYGIYGPPFELTVAGAVEPGSEEYLDSEKYQQRTWNLDAPHSLRDLVARVNAIRRENPAIRNDRSLRFHATDNDHLLCYSKRAVHGENLVVVVVNTDPHHTQAGWVTLDLDQPGPSDDHRYEVDDLLGGGRFTWSGVRNYVELDPSVLPAHIFSVASDARTERDFEQFA